MIQLPDDFYVCERGNTWLVNDDGRNQVAWFDLPGTSQKLEVAVEFGNYPGFKVAVLSPENSTDKHLAEHINENCVGWYIRRCNIEGVNRDSAGYIADPDE